MIMLAGLYFTDEWLESFLIFSIGLFVASAFLLYLLIIRSRNNKIKKDKQRIEYDQFIEKILFSVVFNEATFSSLKADKEFIILLKKVFFREVLMESIINLHKNYDGLYAEKLEQFYRDSGLINDSLKKIQSHRWEIQCKGINELAELNIEDAFDEIIQLAATTNVTLKITALSASIKLGGSKGVKHLIQQTDPIDNWMQVNIIAAFKKHNIDSIEGIELLLKSVNQTVVLLGLKLIKELKLTQKVVFVQKLVAETGSKELQLEAQNVVKALTV